MIKVIYYCDKCRKEIPEDDIFELIPAKPSGKLDVPVDVAGWFAGKHICRKCMSYVFRAMPEKISERKTVVNEEGRLEIAPAEHRETPMERDRKKTYFVSKTNYDRICEMYKDGKEMEEISDVLMVAMSSVSKVIAETKLGEERYKGKSIPHDGGAEIPTALPMVKKKASAS